MLGFGGKKVTTRKGKKITLLNLSEKAGKYAAELRTGIRYTNEGGYKRNKDGDIGLSNEGRAYRSGYLDARKDSANAYKHNKKKKGS